MSQYFTAETDAAINRFNSCEDPEEKKKIFHDEIRPALQKLIENLIFVYRFFKLDNIQSLKDECLGALYEALSKFDPTKGSKGFSYFNVVAKNWFIQKSREKARISKVESQLYLDLDHEAAKNSSNFTVSPHEDELEDREQWIMFYEALDSWRNVLTKKTEISVLEAIIYLMRNPEKVSIYNKKAVYLYLRELTGLGTKQIMTSLKKIKELYDEWKEEYLRTGEALVR